MVANGGETIMGNNGVIEEKRIHEKWQKAKVEVSEGEVAAIRKAQEAV